MDRVNRILRDEGYLSHLKKIKILEAERRFCRHDIEHFLDVCRIAWILNLEQDLHLEKELVYAAGLLHDIGRWVQIENGQDHAEASSVLCKEILMRCGFETEEMEQIQEAIQKHRTEMDGSSLVKVVYKADKLSRKCFACPVIGECKNYNPGDDPWLIY
ncbi:HD domain-containing protein [Parasporobacterium paucivorans]|uniref:HD domain-containing protein n=1 Tax=Parasporobacterium paucivorans DSM 15970 TaxID=1122934 RepID=A0A1M6FWI7_9FIRM|nr:HD domain-containing protein [Parasporobacterium paucivorans]SHJ02063.1 HD domain-containing protein [Parasporobacterium paucivorans DSM 15970]